MYTSSQKVQHSKTISKRQSQRALERAAIILNTLFRLNIRYECTVYPNVTPARKRDILVTSFLGYGAEGLTEASKIVSEVTSELAKRKFSQVSKYTAKSDDEYILNHSGTNILFTLPLDI